MLVHCLSFFRWCLLCVPYLTWKICTDFFFKICTPMMHVNGLLWSDVCCVQATGFPIPLMWNTMVWYSQLFPPHSFWSLPSLAAYVYCLVSYFISYCLQDAKRMLETQLLCDLLKCVARQRFITYLLLYINLHCWICCMDWGTTFHRMSASALAGFSVSLELFFQFLF